MLQHPRMISNIDTNCRRSSVTSTGMPSEMNETGYPFVEESCLELYPEELGIMRIEGGVQIAFYGCQIDTVIFNAGVIAHHRNGDERKS